MSGGDIKLGGGRLRLSDNVSNTVRYSEDAIIVGGKDAVKFYVGDASSGVSEDRQVAQAVDDGFEVDPDGEGFKKVVLDNDPRLSGGSSSGGSSGDVQVSNGFGGFDFTDRVNIDTGYNNMKIGLPADENGSRGISLTHHGSLALAGQAEFWSPGFNKQLFRFNGSDSNYYFGEGDDNADLVKLRRKRSGTDALIALTNSTEEGDVGLVITRDEKFGILREDGDIDYPTAGQSLFYDGTQMSWQNQIIPVQAGTDLSTARPAGAIVCYWLFDVGTDIGSGGVNVVNSVPGDIYYVAAS